MLLSPLPLRPADLSLPITGNLLGSVLDVDGTPQMGATIQLLNKYQRVIAKTISAADGRFAFTSIPNDVYSVRASLPSFLPALKNKILVEGGVDSLLQIHLATLFSNIEVTYAIPAAGMTDDWKWVLRSSPASRPVNRYANVQLGREDEAPFPMFSQTHAMFSVSGGAGGVIDSGSSFGDLGTGFALSTNIYGKNRLKVSGAFGDSITPGPPQMALLATYSHMDSGTLARTPEVTLTVSQVGGIGMPVTGTSANGGMPALRAMSLSVYNVADPLDGVHLEYGATGEAVDYLQHTSRVSPFARLTVDVGNLGEVVAAYSDGGRPDTLARHDLQQDDSLTDASSSLNTATSGLGLMPEISNRNGRLRLEHTQDAELGFKKTIQSVTLAASGFYEDTLDGRVNVAGDTNAFAPSDLLTDTLSTTSYLNIRNYRRTGYLVSSTRNVGDSLQVALAYGRMGGFSAADSLGRAHQGLPLNLESRNMAAINVKVSIPHVGTRITADYGWVESGAIVPRHTFTTQSTYMAPGLNICFRQPLPPLLGMPGRLELTGNLQNLLAQGYLPLAGSDGRPLLVVQSPRTVRGSLNFIF